MQIPSPIHSALDTVGFNISSTEKYAENEWEVIGDYDGETDIELHISLMELAPGHSRWWIHSCSDNVSDDLWEKVQELLKNAS